MELIRLTPPTLSPVSVADLRGHLRMGNLMAEDGVLTGKIAAAVLRVEDYLRESLMAQTWRAIFDRDELELDEDGRYAFPLRMGPVTAITAITVADTTHATTTVAPADYALVGSVDALASVLSSAIGAPRARACVQIDYVAGQTTVAAVRKDAKEAILRIAGNLAEHRTDVAEIHVKQTLAALPRAPRVG